MQKEIEGAKADKSVIEEDILKLMEEAERAKAEVSSEREQLKSREEELKAQTARIEEETQRIKASIDELKVKRSEILPKVDPNVLSQYERILKNKEGSALVPIVGDSCGGCHLILPPQTVNEVRMYSRLVPCESCARILYYVEPDA